MAEGLEFANNLRSLEQRQKLENKPLISNILFQVLLVVERKNKRLVAMIGDETLKKILSTKIHTYMEEMPRKVKKFSRKKFQTAKKNENRLLLSY